MITNQNQWENGDMKEGKLKKTKNDDDDDDEEEGEEEEEELQE